jgi:hypothetical protein
VWRRALLRVKRTPGRHGLSRAAGKLFGSGSYFAANSSKSDIYTTPNAAGRRAGERCILITRVCLGEGSIASRPCWEAIRPPEREDGRGPLNSTVAATTREGGCVEHPEFIVFKEAQALPEYAVWYRHGAGCARRTSTVYSVLGLNLSS